MAVEPRPGGLCLSKSGRDKGRYFIIKEVIDENYVLLTDGMMRKISAPKKKKIKHIELKPYNVESVAEKFISGSKVFDAEIASAIMSSGYAEN